MWFDQGTDHDRRRERQSTPRLRRTRWPAQRRRCLGCLAPLSNGALVCCEACDELAWRITPTLSGDLWESGRRGIGGDRV
jgi:hypothetical protein